MADHVPAAPGCSWEPRPDGVSAYCCRVQGCGRKRRNGRCSLRLRHLEVDASGRRTGRCQEFLAQGAGRACDVD